MSTKEDLNTGCLNFEVISKAVCNTLNVPLVNVTLKCRKKEYVFARYLIIYYARHHTNLLHEQIAYRLNYYDYTASVNAVKRLNKLLKSKDDFILSSMKSINQLLNITR